MGPGKDFWPVLPFSTHCSSLQCVLERDHLAPCSCSCLCSGTRIQPCKWLFSPDSTGLWPAWASLLRQRRRWPCAHRAQALLVAVSQSHACWSMLIQSLGWGSYPLFTCGERTIAQNWLPEVPKSAALLSALLHGELGSCREPCDTSSCISRRAGSERQHPSAASCCFILPILHHTLSYASQHF